MLSQIQIEEMDNMKYHTTSTVCLSRRPSDEGVQIPVVSFNLALIPDLSSEKKAGKKGKRLPQS